MVSYIKRSKSSPFLFHSHTIKWDFFFFFSFECHSIFFKNFLFFYILHDLNFGIWFDQNFTLIVKKKKKGKEKENYKQKRKKKENYLVWHTTFFKNILACGDPLRNSGAAQHTLNKIEHMLAWKRGQEPSVACIVALHCMAITTWHQKKSHTFPLPSLPLNQPTFLSPFSSLFLCNVNLYGEDRAARTNLRRCYILWRPSSSICPPLPKMSSYDVLSNFSFPPSPHAHFLFVIVTT